MEIHRLGFRPSFGNRGVLLSSFCRTRARVTGIQTIKYSAPHTVWLYSDRSIIIVWVTDQLPAHADMSPVKRRRTMISRKRQSPSTTQGGGRRRSDRIDATPGGTKRSHCLRPPRSLSSRTRFFLTSLKSSSTRSTCQPKAC
jgi:hypothetical protein